MLQKHLTRSLFATALILPAIALGAQSASASFGAISYSPATRSHGYSYEFPSREAAIDAAMRECVQASGSRDCELLVWFQNACGALAENPGGTYGYAWADDRRGAEGRAVQACEGRSGEPCRVTRWVCSF